ncbi:hypothetical protein C1889_24405 [Pseudomonas sp. FW507-12TSA]|nr:hypothetical protein C1889_24405 [Pseudomonas sp. FW507-12TSA]
MTAGLVARDASNVVTVDMTKALSQVEGFVITNKENGSSVIQLPAGRNYFYIVTALEDSQRTTGKKPGVTLTQNLLSWSYLFDSGYFALNCRITYGYY